MKLFLIRVWTCTLVHQSNCNSKIWKWPIWQKQNQIKHLFFIWHPNTMYILYIDITPSNWLVNEYIFIYLFHQNSLFFVAHIWHSISFHYNMKFVSFVQLIEKLYFWIVLVCIFKKTHWPFFWSESIETKNLCWQYLKLINSIVSGEGSSCICESIHVDSFFAFGPCLFFIHVDVNEFNHSDFEGAKTENNLFFRKIRNNMEIEIEKTWFKFISICVSTLSICIVLVKERSIYFFLLST